LPTALQQLLGEMSKAEFVREHLHRQPLARPGVGEDLVRCGSWETFADVAAAAGADVMVVRQGERYAGEPPTSRAQLETLCREGYTILFRHAEKHHAGLKRIAGDFARDFDAPVNIHMYATPGGQWGFPWHYDAEEVFILQTAGRKEYSLRKNTVNPWPVEETLPADMQYEREIMPLMRAELAAGDWLYIPGGWWHQARSQASASKPEEVALSLAVGVMPRTALEVLDVLRAKLADSILWRQRLPITGAAREAEETELAARYQQLLASLADDLQRQLARPEMITDLQRHFRAEE